MSVWAWLRRVIGLFLLTVGVAAYLGVSVADALVTPADWWGVTRVVPAADFSLTMGAIETPERSCFEHGCELELNGLISAAPDGRSVRASKHDDVPWHPDVHPCRHLRPASRSADDTPG